MSRREGEEDWEKTGKRIEDRRKGRDDRKWSRHEANRHITLRLICRGEARTRKHKTSRGKEER